MSNISFFGEECRPRYIFKSRSDSPERADAATNGKSQKQVRKTREEIAERMREELKPARNLELELRGLLTAQLQNTSPSDFEEVLDCLLELQEMYFSRTGTIDFDDIVAILEEKGFRANANTIDGDYLEHNAENDAGFLVGQALTELKKGANFFVSFPSMVNEWKRRFGRSAEDPCE